MLGNVGRCCGCCGSITPLADIGRHPGHRLGLLPTRSPLHSRLVQPLPLLISGCPWGAALPAAPAALRLRAGSCLPPSPPPAAPPFPTHAAPLHRCRSHRRRRLCSNSSRRGSSLLLRLSSLSFEFRSRSPTSGGHPIPFHPGRCPLGGKLHSQVIGHLLRCRGLICSRSLFLCRRSSCPLLLHLRFRHDFGSRSFIFPLGRRRSCSRKLVLLCRRRNRCGCFGSASLLLTLGHRLGC